MHLGAVAVHPLFVIPLLLLENPLWGKPNGRRVSASTCETVGALQRGTCQYMQNTLSTACPRHQHGRPGTSSVGPTPAGLGPVPDAGSPSTVADPKAPAAAAGRPADALPSGPPRCGPNGSPTADPPRTSGPTPPPRLARSSVAGRPTGPAPASADPTPSPGGRGDDGGLLRCVRRGDGAGPRHAGPNALADPTGLGVGSVPRPGAARSRCPPRSLPGSPSPVVVRTQGSPSGSGTGG